MRRSPTVEAVVLMMAAAAFRTPALAQDIPPASAVAATMAEDLQLEVWINGVDTDLVAAVRREADGRLLMNADELRAVGLAAPRAPGPVDLSGLPG